MYLKKKNTIIRIQIPKIMLQIFFTQLPKGQFNLRRATGNALAIQKLENVQ